MVYCASTSAASDAAPATQVAPSVLVLFGHSGVGKSHLALGLVRHWQSQLGAESAVYTTAADFRHRWNDAIKRQDELEFRAEFRGRQLLAIDDLQHLPADDHVLEELRYTLDDYEERGATVVVTSVEPIVALPDLSPDLRSRLAGGLALQLAPPGDAARGRIIRHAAHALDRSISDEAADRLARGIEDTANSLFQRCIQTLYARRQPSGQRRATRRAIAGRPGGATPYASRNRCGRRPLSEFAAIAIEKQFALPVDRLRPWHRRVPGPRTGRLELRRNRPRTRRPRSHHHHPQLP